jgi:hypothetical protein
MIQPHNREAACEGHHGKSKMFLRDALAAGGGFLSASTVW